ncbi:MAG: T9SS type A sorting domain-containing protein [Chlorobi bacterium]|nr:T9SS type A sorting domain-containing protein [Chlorobiota bacterium]
MVLAIAGTPTTIAQTNPCPDPNCPDNSWSAVSVFPVRFDLYGHCNGCTGKIYVRTRNCDGSCDIYVEKIDMDNPNCTCAPGDMFKSAIADLFLRYWQQLPSNCQPSKGECVTNWRLLIGGCYELINILTKPPYYQHCPGAPFLADCCIAEYRFCRDGNDNVTFEQIGSTGTTTTCTPPCESFCGYIPFYDPIAAKRALSQSLPESSGVTVIPNPASGKTRLRCTAVEAPEVTAEIIDLQGGVVATTKGTPNADRTVELEINVAKLPAGTYHYRIVAETTAIATGSFTVVQ